VYVDPHILCTPAIADIDADGHDELVIAVSYFYDKDYYDDPHHAQELRGIDKEKYVAGGSGQPWVSDRGRVAGASAGGAGGAVFRMPYVAGPTVVALLSWRQCVTLLSVLFCSCETVTMH